RTARPTTPRQRRAQQSCVRRRSEPVWSCSPWSPPGALTADVRRHVQRGGGRKAAKFAASLGGVAGYACLLNDHSCRESSRMSTAPTSIPLVFGDYALEDRYRLDRGRVYLTGIQALVRVPMMQR